MKRDASKRNAIDQRRHLSFQQAFLKEMLDHNIAIENTLRRIEEQQHQLMSYQAQMEHHKSYGTLVLSIGYAGFFGVWAFLRDILPEKAASLSAILIGFSLLLFVFWEVYTTAESSFSTARIAKGHEDKGRDENSVSLSVHIFPYIWFLTAGSALLGSLLLFYNAIAYFFEIQMWPY